MECPPAFPKAGSVMDIRNVEMAVMKPKPCAVNITIPICQIMAAVTLNL